MSTTAAATSVDIRRSDRAGVDGAVLEAFHLLAPGERMVAVSGDAAPDLLGCLQSRRSGLFEWSLLEAGPQEFRIELVRRGSSAGSLREVGEALAWDHDRLDALEEEVFERLAAGDQRQARELWDEFTVGLRRHIRFEEQVLFPEFESHCGTGPTGVMRYEHREIEALIEGIGLALPNQAAALTLRGQLHLVLGDHNRKEEQVLYPMTDRVLGPEERDALVRRIQAVS
jgi:uncharacterized protein (DUF2249 family)/hemerythrin-like domain-containing protein